MKKYIISLLLLVAPIGNCKSISILDAIDMNNRDEVVRLLQENPDCVNDQDGESHETPLHMAIRYNSIDLVRLLLSVSKIDVNKQTVYGEAPLHFAAELGSIDIIQELLTASDLNPNINLNIDIKQCNGATPLLCALSHIPVREDIAHVLLDYGANPHLISKLNSSPLLAATYQGCSDIVARLLSLGVDPNIQAADTGATPLLLATQLGHKDIVKMLLSIDRTGVNIKSFNHLSALGIVCKNGDSTLFKELLKRSDLDLGNEFTRGMLLRDAAMSCYGQLMHRRAQDNDKVLDFIMDESNDMELISELLKKADVNFRDVNGATALHNVLGKPLISAKFEELIEFFFVHNNIPFDGDSIKERGSYGCTKRDLSVAKVLLQGGSYTTIQDNNGNTPLHLAALKDYYVAHSALLNHADFDLYVQRGDQVVLLRDIAEEKNKEMIKLLLNTDRRRALTKYQLNKDLSNKERQRRLRKIFFERTRNLGVKNYEGKTALDIARECNNKEAEEVLSKEMAVFTFLKSFPHNIDVKLSEFLFGTVPFYNKSDLDGHSRVDTRSQISEEEFRNGIAHLLSREREATGSLTQQELE